MFYGPKNGWTLKVTGKKRAVLWMSPREGLFLASLALRDDAVAALRETPLPEEVVAEIEAIMKREHTPSTIERFQFEVLGERK